MMVHGMGGKEAKITGRDGCQSNLVVLPTPLLVHRPGQLLGKKPAMVEFHVVPHYIICRPRQLVRECAVSYHPICFTGLAIIIGPDCFIVPTSKFRSLGKSPSQIFVAVFAVSFPFFHIVAFPDGRYLAAV